MSNFWVQILGRQTPANTKTHSHPSKDSRLTHRHTDTPTHPNTHRNTHPLTHVHTHTQTHTHTDTNTQTHTHGYTIVQNNVHWMLLVHKAWCEAHYPNDWYVSLMPVNCQLHYVCPQTHTHTHSHTHTRTHSHTHTHTHKQPLGHIEWTINQKIIPSLPRFQSNLLNFSTEAAMTQHFYREKMAHLDHRIMMTHQKFTH